MKKAYPHLNMVKARSGEVLIEEMLKGLDYKVFRYGYETTLQNIINLDTEINPSETKSRISYMPDFLVIDPVGEMSLIEVKVRTTAYDKEIGVQIDNIARYYPECLLVVVDGKVKNPIKACYVKKYRGMEDFKPFRDFLVYDKISGEGNETVKTIEDLAQDLVETWVKARSS